MMLLVLLGMIAGLGVWLVVRELTPSQPQLQAALDNLSPDNLDLRPRTAPEPAAPVSAMSRLGAWAERRLSTVPGLGAPSADLQLLDESATTLYAQRVVGALIGLALPLVAGVVMQALNLDLSFALPGALGIFFALVGWLIPDRRIRERATRARADFARGAVAYLQMVAIGLVSSMQLVTALQAAAETSDGAIFRHIRRELQRAEWARQTPEEALARLGHRLNIPELEEIADITRASGQGAAVYEMLLARASSLDDRIQSSEGARADEATEMLSTPIALIAVIFVLAMVMGLAMTVL